MKRKLITLTLVLGISIFSLYSQDENFFTSYQSSGPDAAGAAMGGDIPVSYHTGSATISIPIWTASSRTLSIPIGLSYNTSGIKVSQPAGWVGLGWSLSSGGVIARTRRGVPDEVEQFEDQDCLSDECGGYTYTGRYMHKPSGSPESQWFKNVSCTTSVQEDVKEDALEGRFDTQPDLFTFSCGAGQGQFVFSVETDGTVSIKTITKSNLRFSYTTNVDDEIDSWTIVGEDGTIYEFSEFETIDASLECNGQAAGYDEYSDYPTSWHLTKVIAPNYIDTISLEYATVTENYGVNSSEIEYNNDDNCNSIGTLACTTSVYTVESKKITKISTPLHDVEFDRSSGGRNDLNSGGCKLDSIMVKYKDGTLFKKYSFYYDDFTSDYEQNGALIWDAHLNIRENYLKKRLRLDSIIVSAKGGEKMPPYKFDYYYDSSDSTLCLPPRNSTRQDYLGYYNGKHNWNTLISNASCYGCNLTGANRDVDTIFTKANMLKKIIYPTGSYTELEYQAHRYKYIQAGSTPGSEVLSGGLRIFKIRNKDNDGNEIVKRYDYTDGRLVTKEPTYCYFSPDANIARSSENMNTRGNAEGYHIGYDKVTEYTLDSDGEDNGCIEYEFAADDAYMYEGGGMYSTPLDGYPFPPRNSFNWLRGKVESMDVVNTSDQDVSSAYYTYTVTAPVNLPQVMGCVVHEEIYGDPVENMTFTDKVYYIAVEGKNNVTYTIKDGDGIISTTQTNTYNTNNYVSKTEITSPDLEKYIHYVSDYTTGVFAKMNERNMLTAIYKTESLNGSDTISANISEYDYYLFNSNNDTLVLPEFIYEWNGEDFELTSGNYDYNIYGNLIEYLDKQAMYHSIVWGYKNSFPLAKILNAEYDDVENALENDVLTSYSGISTIEDLNYVTNESTLRNIFDDLRDELPEAFIVSFTYDELKGKLSECDANKITTHYEYDKWGRVVNIKNDDGKLLQHKRYNVVSQ